MVEFEGQHQAYQEVIQALHLQVRFDLGFLIFGLELVVFFVGEGRVEVQKAEDEGRDEAVGASDAVGGYGCEDEVVISVHVVCIMAGIRCVKKELKHSRPER